MKKILLVSLLTVLCLSMASMAFAAAITITPSQATVIGGATFKPSTNVSLSVYSIATGYCATSVHASAIKQTAGKEFGTLSTGAIIQSKTAPTSGTVPTACTAADSLPGNATDWQ
jgi:hypothetical protein